MINVCRSSFQLIPSLSEAARLIPLPSNKATSVWSLERIDFAFASPETLIFIVIQTLAGLHGLREGVVDFEDDAFGAVAPVELLLVLALHDGEDGIHSSGVFATYSAAKLDTAINPVLVPIPLPGNCNAVAF